jgi:hypothetical protein
MPTPKQYEDSAEKQRAYRERVKQSRIEERATKGLPPAPAIPTMPGTTRWKALMETATATLEAMRDEMQDYHNQRTERWQESERAEQLGTTIEALENAIGELREISL